MQTAKRKQSSPAKQGKGLLLKKFDKKALSWGRKQYGNVYAKKLWENTLPNSNVLDLTDDLDFYVFEEHCEAVYDVLCYASPKNADTLYRTPKFCTVKWQLENRQRQYEKLFATWKQFVRTKLKGNCMHKEWRKQVTCENTSSSVLVWGNLWCFKSGCESTCWPCQIIMV